jgi:UDP-N-acetylglucosamine 2-epimerase (non-hydrolysing)
MKLVSIVSARPNFIKLAGVYHALKESGKSDVEHIVVHTGQHHDPIFSDIFFKELNLPEPEVNLNVQSNGDNRDTAERTKQACIPVLQKIQPDVVLVYGDVSGALGGAWAAHDLNIKLGHIESGLRSFDETMPEEKNRKEIDNLANLLFVTEKSGVENLVHEGITENVHFVGNTMIDTLVRMKPVIEKQSLPEGLPEKYGVVTLHRPGNVDNKSALELSFAFLSGVASKFPLVFPMHLRTKSALEEHGMSHSFSKDIKVLGPLGYLSFLRLVQGSSFVLTDSGGIQEETVFLGKKCFTLRKNTERPSTIDAKSNELINMRDEKDFKRVLAFCAKPKDPVVKVPEFWDGHAGERISDILVK